MCGIRLISVAGVSLRPRRRYAAALTRGNAGVSVQFLFQLPFVRFEEGCEHLHLHAGSPTRASIAEMWSGNGFWWGLVVFLGGVVFPFY